MPSFMEKLSQSIIGRNIVAEIDMIEATMKKRMATAVELKAARNARESQGAALGKTMEDARAEYQRLQAKHKAELEAVAATYSAARSAVTSLDCVVDRLEADMRRSAPEQIERTINQLRQDADDTRGALQTTSVKGWRDMEERPGYQVKFHDQQTNQKAIHTRLEAIRTAIDKLESLKLEFIADDALEGVIEKILAKVPDRETLKTRETFQMAI